MIIPDLLLRHGTEVRAVADCKYKLIAKESDVVQHDYYQVLAYCTALNVPQGVLIYPKHEIPLDDVLTVKHSSIEIQRLCIDLAGKPGDVRQECDRLASVLTEGSRRNTISAA